MSVGPFHPSLFPFERLRQCPGGQEHPAAQPPIPGALHPERSFQFHPHPAVGCGGRRLVHRGLRIPWDLIGVLAGFPLSSGNALGPVVPSFRGGLDGFRPHGFRALFRPEALLAGLGAGGLWGRDLHLPGTGPGGLGQLEVGPSYPKGLKNWNGFI